MIIWVELEMSGDEFWSSASPVHIRPVVSSGDGAGKSYIALGSHNNGKWRMEGMCKPGKFARGYTDYWRMRWFLELIRIIKEKDCAKMKYS